VVVGDRADNPLHRAPEVKRPRRERQEEVQVLSVRQIDALAEAATRRPPAPASLLARPSSAASPGTWSALWSQPVLREEDVLALT
jgi:hypothetical protein